MSSYTCTYASGRDDGVDVSLTPGSKHLRVELVTGKTGIITAKSDRIQGVVMLKEADALAMAREILNLLGGDDDE